MTKKRIQRQPKSDAPSYQLDLPNLGQRIKHLRVEILNMSLAEFAEMVPISTSYLIEIENGQRVNPSLSVVARIAAVLGVSLDYLVGFSPQSKGVTDIPGPDALPPSYRQLLSALGVAVVPPNVFFSAPPLDEENMRTLISFVGFLKRKQNAP